MKKVLVLTTNAQFAADCIVALSEISLVTITPTLDEAWILVQQTGYDVCLFEKMSIPAQDYDSTDLAQQMRDSNNTLLFYLEDPSTHIHCVEFERKCNAVCSETLPYDASGLPALIMSKQSHHA